jgi:hypothetical protein
MDLDTYEVLWQNGFQSPFDAYSKAERVAEYTRKTTLCPELNLSVRDTEQLARAILVMLLKGLRSSGS